MGNIDLIIILTTAFLGSVGHCIGMCGGIVVAYSSTKIDHKSSYLHQTASHLSYNFGRVTTYTILGGMFGYLGQVLAFTPTTKGVLFLFTGLLMILAGLSLIGNLKFLNSAEWSVSKYAWYQNSFRKLMSSKSYGSFLPFRYAQRYHTLWACLLFCYLCCKYCKPLKWCTCYGYIWFSHYPCTLFLGFHHKVSTKRKPTRYHDEACSSSCNRLWCYHTL